MEKINVAELLKDCPQGMELNCTLFEGLEFDGIVDNEYLPIRCRLKNPNGGYNVYNFTKYGCWLDTTFSKCVIFPKGKTTWEEFVPPRQFKAGDILISGLEDCCNPFIFKQTNGFGNAQCYCAITAFGGLILNCHNWTPIKGCRLATEEEKQKLFDAIKANGYKWNEETKTLEKLIEKPNFKVGDRIRKKGENSTFPITDVNEAHYFCGKYVICDTCDNDWELVPNKFDINTLKPFDKVLVRNHEKNEWQPNFFNKYCKEINSFKLIGVCTPTYITNEHFVNYCIPYEGNQHLLGTTNDCDDFYKIWE